MALLQPLKFALSATAINFNVMGLEMCANITNANLRFLEPMLRMLILKLQARKWHILLQGPWQQILYLTVV